MAEFTVKDMTFRSGKMDLFKQIQVLRRIGPFVPDMVVTYRAMEKGATAIDAAIVMGPDVLKTFGSMTDDDVQYIISACLEIAQIYQSGAAWAPLAPNGRLQFQQVDLFTISQIVWKVLEDNLRPFFLDLKAMATVEKPAAE